MEVEREYSVVLRRCLGLLRKINWARRVGKWDLAASLLEELHLVEGRK